MKNVNMTISMTKESLNNLKVFLSRVNLTGEEVPAFSEIMNSLYKANEEECKE